MKRKGKNMLAAAIPATSDDWRVQDAMQTLKRAEQIKADPKLHTAAKNMARQEAQSLQKIARKK